MSDTKIFYAELSQVTPIPMEEKNYLLFAGDDYYPLGGAQDFKSAHSTVKEAKKAHNPNEYDVAGGWANIFDVSSKKIVMVFYRGTWRRGNPDNW